MGTIDADTAKRLELEEACRVKGREIVRGLPPGIGFVFLLFDFGPSGNIAYLSNAARESTTKALEELVANLKLA